MPFWLPPGAKPLGTWKKKSPEARQRLVNSSRWGKPKKELREHPGKKFGAVTGGWISDLVSLRKAIILCWRCQPKFNHKRAHYYKDERFPYVIGRCDGCREYMNHQAKLYIHESFLSEPSGRTMSGQVWTPR